MFYVYVLQNSTSKELYYGYTSDLKRRISQHNSKGERWRLVYYEAYLTEEDARMREKKLKHYGQARAHLKRRLKTSLILKISAG